MTLNGGIIVIDDSDITFVVQGPVQQTPGREQIEGITQRCLASIRQLFPSSTIILSTWENQPIEGLDYDVLVESVDPGSNKVFNDGTPLVLNNNRQLKSSNAGLAAVSSRYAVKLRSDNLLSGRAFVDTYCKYYDLPRAAKFQYFKQRIITSSAFFIGSHYGKTVHFHKSDLFDFGLTEDLLKVWPNKPIPEIHFELNSGKKQRYPATEQFLTLSWLSDLLGEPLHINSKADDSASLPSTFWGDFIANNIIVDSPEALQLDVTERFYQRGNLSLEYDLEDWLALNHGSKPKLDKKRAERAFKQFCGRIARRLP